MLRDFSSPWASVAESWPYLLVARKLLSAQRLAQQQTEGESPIIIILLAAAVQAALL
jgi:hypothetical protein